MSVNMAVETKSPSRPPYLICLKSASLLPHILCYFMFYSSCVSDFWFWRFRLERDSYALCHVYPVDIFEPSGGGGGGELRIWVTFLLCPPPSPSLPDDTSTQPRVAEKSSEMQISLRSLSCKLQDFCCEDVENQVEISPLLLVFNERWAGGGSLCGGGVLQGPGRCLDWPHHVSESESRVNDWLDSRAGDVLAAEVLKEADVQQVVTESWRI